MHRQKQLELLKLLLEATRNGRATWHREGNRFHQAQFSGVRCSLRFKYPMLAGDDGSDADAVDVTVDACVATFYSGTEGFDLVSEILAAAHTEYGDHAASINEQLDKMIEKIRPLARS